jgi:hypothetical protein
VRTGYGRDEELRLAGQGRADLVDHVAGSLHAALPWLLRALSSGSEKVLR